MTPVLTIRKYCKSEIESRANSILEKIRFERPSIRTCFQTFERTNNALRSPEPYIQIWQYQSINFYIKIIDVASNNYNAFEFKWDLFIFIKT